MKPGRPTSRWRRWAGNFLVLFVTTILMLLAGEVAARMFGAPLIMPRWVESAPYGIRKQIGNIRGEIVTPHYRHKFDTNSKGFRGTREYAVPKPAKVFRIITLGDSVVDGYGVEDDQTFSALLERKLSAQRPTEVANLGIAGFSTAEELIQLQNVGLELQPDLVVLGYFVNDHFENVTSELFVLENGQLVRNPKPADPALFWRDNLSKIPGYNFLCQHSYLLNLVRSKMSGHFRGKLGEKHKLDGNSYVSDRPTAEQVALTTALLDEFIKTCTDRGIKVVILNLPMEKNGEWMRNMPTDKLKRAGQAQVVDVAAEIYRGRDIGDIAHPGNYHPKPLGHQLIADWLADYVQKNIW
jgi:lysophospholipase L1-like esterase